MWWEELHKEYEAMQLLPHFYIPKKENCLNSLDPVKEAYSSSNLSHDLIPIAFLGQSKKLLALELFRINAWDRDPMRSHNLPCNSFLNLTYK